MAMAVATPARSTIAAATNQSRRGPASFWGAPEWIVASSRSKRSAGGASHSAESVRALRVVAKPDSERHQVRTSTLDSYRKFASNLADDIGTHRVVDVGPETLTQWQSKLLDKYAPYTVLNRRKGSRQAFTEAVMFGLIPANPFDLVTAPNQTVVLTKLLGRSA